MFIAYNLGQTINFGSINNNITCYGTNNYKLYFWDKYINHITFWDKFGTSYLHNIYFGTNWMSVNLMHWEIDKKAASD